MRGNSRTWIAAATAVVALTAALTAPTPAAAGGPNDVGAASGLPPLPEQQRYRAELGLPSDAVTVTSLNARWAAGEVPDATVEGAVFTSAEEAELDARESAAAEIAQAARAYFVGPEESAFGGVHISHATGQTVVSVTRDPDHYLGVLRALVGTDARLVVERVRFALADLERIAATVGEAAADLAAEGVEIVGVTVDEVANVVEVGLVENSTVARSAVIEQLDVPGDAELVTFGASVPDQELGAPGLDAPPVKGGQQLLTYDTEGSFYTCTSGFVAYQRTRTDIGVYVTDYHLVTAGHCQKAHDAYFLQTELYVVGRTDRTAYFDGSDSLRIPLVRQQDHSNRVLIAPGHDRLIYARQAVSADVVGERVCMSGVTTGGELCGTLLTRGYLSRTRGNSFPSQRLTSFPAVGGDSGGSVLLNSQAKGIVRCRAFYKNRWRMCYGHIDTALAKLGLTDVNGV